MPLQLTNLSRFLAIPNTSENGHATAPGSIFSLVFEDAEVSVVSTVSTRAP